MPVPPGVVVALHGGRPTGWQRVGPWYPAVWWHQFLITHLRRRLAPQGVPVATVVNTVRGWNEPELPAVEDARRTIRTIRQAWPRVPMVLLGYSMGGRVVGRIADEVGASGVVAVAPWWPEPEDGAGLVGVPTVIVQGTADVVTPARDSLDVARRLVSGGTPVTRHEIVGGEHLLAWRRPTWLRVTTDGLRAVLGVGPYAGQPTSLRGQLAVRH